MLPDRNLPTVSWVTRAADWLFAITKRTSLVIRLHGTNLLGHVVPVERKWLANYTGKHHTTLLVSERLCHHQRGYSGCNCCVLKTRNPKVFSYSWPRTHEAGKNIPTEKEQFKTFSGTLTHPVTHYRTHRLIRFLSNSLTSFSTYLKVCKYWYNS